MHRPGPDDPPVFYFQLCLAGWGHFQLYGEEPQKVTPGKAFFALIPSRHRYYLPRESPGWTFAWIGVHHPSLIARVAKPVKATGPLLDLRPDGALTAVFLRLVRGAIKKDFRDRFDAELALWEFVLAYERWAHEARDSSGDSYRLLEEVRSFVVASLPKTIDVDALAAEYGMTRSHFSHFFRMHTGLTPAHFATEVRVHEAARLLRETRAPLKSIAGDCGFANGNHFSKVFRRYQHLSPLSYRRTIR
jgi:AraC-like DNA-binding protein